MFLFNNNSSTLCFILIIGCGIAACSSNNDGAYRLQLGPVTLTFEKAYITKEDLASLKLAVDSGADNITVRFKLVEGSLIQAWYAKWLPSEQSDKSA